MPPRKQKLSLPPKNPKKTRQAPTYDTFEDAIDGGVEQEEKGERWRVGDKAKRHFESACEMYERAISFEPSRFEGPYNLARTLYHLSVAFLLPPYLLQPLERSIALYRHALTLTADPQLQVDTGFNLATALISLADVKDDFGEDGDTERSEAVGVLVEIKQRQEELLRAAREGQNGEAEAGPGYEGEEGGPGEDGEAEDGDEGGEAAGRAWEETVTTPSTLLDTYLLLLPLLPSSTSPLAPANLISEIQALASLCVQSGAPRDIDILTALASSRIKLVQDRDEGWLDLGRMLVLELESAKAQLPESTPTALKVDLICALSDAQTALASSVRLSLMSSPTAPTASQTHEVWTLLSAATQNSTAALTLLTHPSSSAFPSATSLAADSSSPVLLALTRLSLARATLAKAPFGSPSATKNGSQLLSNASTYARRALEAGPSGLQTVVPPYPAPASALGTTTAGPGWTSGGWEVESTALEAVLVTLRVLFLQADEPACMRVLTKVQERLAGKAGWVRAWVGEVEEDEGGLEEVERTFWSNVVQSLDG